MIALLIPWFGMPAHAEELPENEVSYKLGDGLRFTLDEGRHTFRIGGFVQPSWQPTFADGDVEQILVPKRTQFVVDGSLEDDRILFEVLTDFSLQQPLLNAWVGVRVGRALTVSAGQKPNPANLREMLFNEGYLSFPERSLLSQAFSETGREFGLFADVEIPLGNALVRPSFAVTSGDGRNSFGVDSRDVDLGGFKYGGRLDLLPLGDFAEGNRGFVTDVAHESRPRLALGGAVSFNDGASAPNGEGHGEFELFDADGNPQLPGYTKLNADLVVKWQGLSLLGEYVNTTASRLPGSFTDPVGGNPLVTGQISEFLVLGSGINAQVGYFFDFGLGIDLRYSTLLSEFDQETSQLRDTTATGAVITAFVQDHDLKFQLAGSRVQAGDFDPFVVAELLAHLRF
ncbi:MAG: hypothetical protein AAGA48_40055 [Myxococcota bacterium]